MAAARSRHGYLDVLGRRGASSQPTSIPASWRLSTSTISRCRVHNIAEEELEEGVFDLVHARAVLMHIPQRQVALKRMVSALKPGGLLVVEEGDFISFEVDPRVGEHATNLWRKAAKMRSVPGGPDGFYGRRLYGDVLALGMVDVGAEGTVHMGRGATSHAEFWRLSFTQIRDRLLTVGEFSPGEVDQLVALFDDPNFFWMEGIGMTVWGRSSE